MIKFRKIEARPYLQQPICDCGGDLVIQDGFIREGSEYRFEHICNKCDTKYELSESEKAQVKFEYDK